MLKATPLIANSFYSFSKLIRTGAKIMPSKLVGDLPLMSDVGADVISTAYMAFVWGSGIVPYHGCASALLGVIGMHSDAINFDVRLTVSCGQVVLPFVDAVQVLNNRVGHDNRLDIAYRVSVLATRLASYGQDIYWL